MTDDEQRLLLLLRRLEAVRAVVNKRAFAHLSDGAEAWAEAAAVEAMLADVLHAAAGLP